MVFAKTTPRSGKEAFVLILTLFYSSCLVAGLLILFRDRWRAGSRRAQTEAQKRFEYLLEQNVDDGPLASDEPQSAEDLQHQSPTVRRIAEALDRSELFNDEEGQNALQTLERWLVQAGMRERFAPTQAIAYTLSIWSLGIVTTILFDIIVGIPTVLFLIFVGLILLYPPLYLRSAIKTRQDSIAAEVPFFIQQIYMTLSTGAATIDDAIVRVASTAEEDPYNSYLAQEFGQAQVEYRLGSKSFEEAVREIGYRTGVMSVENLCEAIVQGYKTGASMENVLLEYSSQAQEMWRQDIRAYKNRKEPIVTIGMVISMFGAFVIWGTPLLVEFINSFSGA